MIENNPFLSSASVDFGTGDYGPTASEIDAQFTVSCHGKDSALKRVPQTLPSNPPQLWITLWATYRRRARGHENSRAGTDCSNFRQKESLANQ
jgi:hypothetical protein